MEDTVKNNYKSLLRDYEVASKHYQATGEAKLLGIAINSLLDFESKVAQLWSYRELFEVQKEIMNEGLQVI
ncbi:hypothetical protein [Priestia megaterium]|uniref:hypothetical protein n=1 Tax=Priestia megaterium TaxID=1404 RepID=UPI00207A0560|nr:hypothetical protein [Priestia megaterium]USL32931.1 hypothetical protein LIT30_12280 [Priestia megaterium]